MQTGQNSYRSRKLIAAARAGTLGFRAHGPNRPSAAISEDSGNHSPLAAVKTASEASGILLRLCMSKRVFRYSSVSNRIAE